MADVSAHDVYKRYGDVEVLKGVSVDIAHGEMLVILGASGCGKTTFLRLVAGLEKLSGGDIRIGDRVVNDIEPKDRDIAMVFQNYALYPHMSVYDNMAYGLRNRGTPKPEIDRRVKEAASVLGLGEFLKRQPRQLSGGQRQRVAMGRAMVREPKVFLFDEPLSNLDAALRTQMRVEVRDLQRRLDTTGIFVTHDQVEAMTLADRIMLLNAGRIEQIGPPLDLYAKPESTFVATFIGAPKMNLVAAEMTAGSAELSLPGGNRLHLPSPAQFTGSLTLGIRPEDLRGVEEGGIAVKVHFVERLGADQIVFADLDGHGNFLVRLPGSVPVGEGEILRVEAPPASLHLFDAVSGRRLGEHQSPLAA